MEPTKPTISARTKFTGVIGTPREQEVIERIVRGDESRRQIAREVGCDQKTVQRVAKKNAEIIRQKQEEASLYVLQKFEENKKKLVESWIATSSDSENRAQPQMADVMGKWAGVTGQKGGIHIGDVHNSTANVQVNQQYAAEYDPEVEAALRAELGLGRVVDVPVEDEDATS